MYENVTTTVSITIERRTVEVQVRSPNPLEEVMLMQRLPDEILDDPEPDPARLFTYGELERAAKNIVKATTDLPHRLIEQLPARAIQNLSDAGQDVIMKMAAKESKEHDIEADIEETLQDVENDRRVEAMEQFVLDEN